MVASSSTARSKTDAPWVSARSGGGANLLSSLVQDDAVRVRPTAALTRAILQRMFHAFFSSAELQQVRACVALPATCVAPQRRGRRTLPLTDSMSDFPSSEVPSIPWSEALSRIPLGITEAPGPPTAAVSHRRIAGKKTRRSPTVSPRRSIGRASSDEEQYRSMHNGSEVESWDPMASDYRSREFNSYETGAGALMQAAKESGGGDFTLFVTNIPLGLPKEAFRELFGRAGQVKKVYIQKGTTDRETTYGFVDYGTIREAESAIQMLNDFDMGSGVRLVVKVSETKEDRDKRAGQEEGGGGVFEHSELWEVRSQRREASCQERL
ncbi:hypothetical protein GBAR_LOCUS26408 [Geodia barretti]|uniref:RRM domain-containing protein n=1 Tax=Geodia barretti TaxID=519541 RepID=A0AA35TGT5_GEOBA|nr:hypothetical protein GBAR_LOCUS26408 [Geodia barretti]